MKTLSGISVSRGINIGPIYQFRHLSLEFETVQVQDKDKEWQRFENAVSVTKKKLEKIHEKAVMEIGTDEAAIFRAHLMILEDPDLIDGTKAIIFDEGKNSEAAFFEVSEQYCQMLEEIDDDYIQARVIDIRDVRSSVLAVLLGLGDAAGIEVEEPSIIVSHDLTPSDSVSIQKALIEGFCTVEGGTTSHTAILARSLGVPALVGVPEEIESVPNKTLAIIDGYNGKIILEPDQATIDAYEKISLAKKEIFEKALAEAQSPAVTTDGQRIEIFANIGNDNPEDIHTAIANGAEGVGLLRTEFIFLDMKTMPDESVQYQKYSSVVKGFGKRPVILRTLDIGGDKQLPYLDLPYELNPFLGVRGLRLCLRHKELFKAQIRAVLRASNDGNLRVMFPMVTKISEIKQAKEMINACRDELKSEGIPVPASIEVGIMIEIPAAAIMAEHLAREVDFFSIGTNDLTQYTLAVDRTNTFLADLANAFDPAVLCLIRNVCDSAHKYGKKVGVCGELGGDPLAIPILLGIGLDELSMNTPAIPIAKQIVRQLSKSEMQQLADEVLSLETPADVKEHVSQRLPFLAGLI